MKRCWDEQQLIEHSTLFASEQPLLGNRTDRGKIGVAVLLKFGQKLKARVEAYAGPAPLSAAAGAGGRPATA
ncbi:hypothetical protein [uncultured Thiodictyon sp.]|jgi:hypothetical protein|uniref:hypothetical protein n=1 Tax=uncultured Thiodictyon sp. TaxID=1846217 RepID=UPI0025CFFEA8|nr:hypothetical protein [uncultured Thiodictyon sp.]